MYSCLVEGFDTSHAERLDDSESMPATASPLFLDHVWTRRTHAGVLYCHLVLRVDSEECSAYKLVQLTSLSTCRRSIASAVVQDVDGCIPS